MRPIDADSLKSTLGLSDNCKTCKIGESKNCQFASFSVYGICTMLDDSPTVALETGWISVKDRLPENGKHVLASCEIRPIGRSKRRYVCDAFYSAPHTIKEHWQYNDDCYDYCEEEDEYYLKEGWYEVIKNWDEYSSIVIGDFVTHWMPLPEPPETD